MNKTYSIEEKQYWVSLYQQGEAIPKICEKHSISRSSLYRWINQYAERKAPKTKKLISGHRLLCLEEENLKLRQENDILKHADCWQKVTRREKMELIDQLYDQYPLHTLCSALKLPRGTYYNYKKSLSKEKQIDKQNAEYKPIIRQIFDQHKGRLGARPVRAKMKQMGIEIGTRRVSALMKEMGLNAVIPKPKDASFHPRSSFYVNKLMRNFDPEQPNVAWVSDITYVPVLGRFYYVCVVIDLFSRKILSYQISHEITTEICVDCFTTAYLKRGKPQGVLFHSDQGAQYTSHIFRHLLKSCGVTQSFSTPGVPYDNAVAESFFSAFKKQETYRHQYQTKKELEASVAEYIEFFNSERPHRKLKMLTPVEFEEAYYSNSN